MNTTVPGFFYFPSASRALAALCALFLSLALVSPAMAEKNPGRVRDLAYGSVLYAYFQQDYFGALSELLVADQQGSIVQEQHNSELLRGGIYLSYGMDEVAEQLFGDVINAGAENRTGASASPENIARAWFYLGKLRHKKGDYQRAAESFERVNADLTRKLWPEYAFLSDSAKLRNGDQSASEARFQPKVAASSSWSYYREYNSLLDQLAKLDTTGSQPERAQLARELIALANRIGDSTDSDNVAELLALRDQIYTSAGYLALQAESSELAGRSFRRVRQDSLLAGQALLGYGWAAANADDYRAALAPWQQLASQSMIEPTTQEALLAVPFAYEKLGADAAALAEYDASVAALQGELQLLNGIDNYLADMSPAELAGYYQPTSAQWLEDSELQASEERGRFASEVLHNRLLDLLAANHFNYLEQQRQDVQWLLQELARWELELEAVRFVVDAREQRRQQAVSASALSAISERVQQLQRQREWLSAPVAAAVDTQSPDHDWQLMTADERKLHARIEHASELLQRIENNPQRDTAFGSPARAGEFELQRKQLAWAQGLLQWQVNQQASERNWQNRKLLNGIDAALEEAELRRSELLELAASEQRQRQELAEAAAVQQRIARQRSSAGQIAAQIDEQILATLRQDVKQLQQRSTLYLAQASMARARLLDTLSETGEPLAAVDAQAAGAGELP